MDIFPNDILWKFSSTDPAYTEITVYHNGYVEGLTPGGIRDDITKSYWPIGANNLTRVTSMLELIKWTRNRSISYPINKWILPGVNNVLPATYYLIERSALDKFLYVTRIVDTKYSESDCITSHPNDTTLVALDNPTGFLSIIEAEGRLNRLVFALDSAKKMYGRRNERSAQALTMPIASMQWDARSINNFLSGEYGMSAGCQYFIATWLHGDVGGFIVPQPRDSRISAGMFIPLRLTADISMISPSAREEIIKRTIWYQEDFARRFREIRDRKLAEVARIEKATAIEQLADCFAIEPVVAGIRKWIDCNDINTADIMATYARLQNASRDHSAQLQKLSNIEDNFSKIIHYLMSRISVIRKFIKDTRECTQDPIFAHDDVRGTNIKLVLANIQNNINRIDFDVDTHWNFFVVMLRILSQ